ncbi:MAG: hypothetical protein ISR65_09070 [Bacteriovoracaceae bacterium]|nr:hypothetical protein [Bacteriovoracaceae bacterium]
MKDVKKDLKFKSLFLFLRLSCLITLVYASLVISAHAALSKCTFKKLKEDCFTPQVALIAKYKWKPVQSDFSYSTKTANVYISGEVNSDKDGVRTKSKSENFYARVYGTDTASLDSDLNVEFERKYKRVSYDKGVKWSIYTSISLSKMTQGFNLSGKVQRARINLRNLDTPFPSIFNFSINVGVKSFKATTATVYRDYEVEERYKRYAGKYKKYTSKGDFCGYFYTSKAPCHGEQTFFYSDFEANIKEGLDEYLQRKQLARLKSSFYISIDNKRLYLYLRYNKKLYRKFVFKRDDGTLKKNNNVKGLLDSISFQTDYIKDYMWSETWEDTYLDINKQAKSALTLLDEGHDLKGTRLITKIVYLVRLKHLVLEDMQQDLQIPAISPFVTSIISNINQLNKKGPKHKFKKEKRGSLIPLVASMIHTSTGHLIKRANKKFGPLDMGLEIDQIFDEFTNVIIFGVLENGLNPSSMNKKMPDLLAQIENMLNLGDPLDTQKNIMNCFWKQIYKISGELSTYAPYGDEAYMVIDLAQMLVTYYQSINQKFYSTTGDITTDMLVTKVDRGIINLKNSLKR